MLMEMHGYFKRGYTPKVKPKTGCNLCSIKELCLPELCKKQSVGNYYAQILKEDEV